MIRYLFTNTKNFQEHQFQLVCLSSRNHAAEYANSPTWHCACAHVLLRFQVLCERPDGFECHTDPSSRYVSSTITKCRRISRIKLSPKLMLNKRKRVCFTKQFYRRCVLIDSQSKRYRETLALDNIEASQLQAKNCHTQARTHPRA